MFPVVAETLVITGAGAAVELIDTLSNVAVARVDVLPLVTPSPIYTVCAMLIVWLVPSCAQFTPSKELYPLSVFPLRTTFTQYGSVALPPTAWPVLPPVLVR